MSKRQEEFARECEAPIGNYYGNPKVVETHDGRFLMDVENHDEWDWEHAIEVSRAFAEAWFAEFAKTEGK